MERRNSYEFATTKIKIRGSRQPNVTRNGASIFSIRGTPKTDQLVVTLALSFTQASGSIIHFFELDLTPCYLIRGSG